MGNKGRALLVAKVGHAKVVAKVLPGLLLAQEKINFPQQKISLETSAYKFWPPNILHWLPTTDEEQYPKTSILQCWMRMAETNVRLSLSMPSYIEENLFLRNHLNVPQVKFRAYIKTFLHRKK